MQIPHFLHHFLYIFIFTSLGLDTVSPTTNTCIVAELSARGEILGKAGKRPTHAFSSIFLVVKPISPRFSTTVTPAAESVFIFFETLLALPVMIPPPIGIFL